MDNNQVLLKSSMFGGFKKKDVLSYIFELNETSQEAKQKLAEQVEELTTDHNDAVARVSELEQRLESIEAQYDDASVRLEQETAKAQQAKEKIAKLEADAQKYERVLDEQNAELSKLTSLLNEFQDRQHIMDEKNRQVEIAASQIAGLIASAKSDAQNVLESAHIEADAVIRAARQKVEMYLNDANRALDDGYLKYASFKNDVEKIQALLEEQTRDINAKMKVVSDSVALVDYVRVDRIEDIRPSRHVGDSVHTSVVEAPKPLPKLMVDDIEIDKPKKDAEGYAREFSGRYGLRKDDSGFFRLSAER